MVGTYTLLLHRGTTLYKFPYFFSYRWYILYKHSYSHKFIKDYIKGESYLLSFNAVDKKMVTASPIRENKNGL